MKNKESIAPNNHLETRAPSYEGEQKTIDTQGQTRQKVEDILSLDQNEIPSEREDYVEKKQKNASEMHFSKNSQHKEIPKNIIVRKTSNSKKQGVPQVLKSSAGGAVFGVTAGTMVLLMTGGALTFPALAAFGGVGALGGALGGALVRLMRRPQ